MAVITEEAPLPIGPYSQAIKAEGLVFVSGQIPLDARTGELFKGDVKDLLPKNKGAATLYDPKEQPVGDQMRL